MKQLWSQGFFIQVRSARTKPEQAKSQPDGGFEGLRVLGYEGFRLGGCCIWLLSLDQTGHGPDMTRQDQTRTIMESRGFAFSDGTAAQGPKDTRSRPTQQGSCVTN